MFIIMPTIPLLDFSATTLRLDHIKVQHIVAMFPSIKCIDTITTWFYMEIVSNPIINKQSKAIQLA